MLFRHSKDHYRAMLRAAPSDAELVELERAGFGVSHDALGAALCESWGLAAPAVASVRHHVAAQATGELPAALAKRPICALSVIAHALMNEAESLDEIVTHIAAQADLDETLALRGTRKVQEQLQTAAARASAA